jgi:GAF domain-containing protein
MLSGEHLAGVMTLYATETNAFTDDHKRIVELIAKQIAYVFWRSANRESGTHRDSLIGPPNSPATRIAH